MKLVADGEKQALVQSGSESGTETTGSGPFFLVRLATTLLGTPCTCYNF